MNAITHRLRDDDGISLVELMFAIVILGIALTAVAATLTSSLGAIQSNEARVRATALSQEELESISSLPWQAIGLEASDPELTQTNFEGDDIVFLPDGSDPRIPAHEEVINRDGRDYTVRRWITWVDEGGSQDYKRLVVQLEWQSIGQLREMRSETLRAAEPLEQSQLEVEFTDIRGVLSNGPEIPLRGAADDDDETEVVGGPAYRNLEMIILDIHVNDPTADVRVSFRDRYGALVEKGPVGPSNTENRQLVISDGSHQFPNGPFAFVVTAIEQGPDGDIASNTETLEFFQPVDIRTPDFVHDGGQIAVCVDGSGTPVSPLSMVVEIEGVTPADAGDGNLVALDIDGLILFLDPIEETIYGGRFTVSLPGPYAPPGVAYRITAENSPSILPQDSDAFPAPAPDAPAFQQVILAEEGVC